LPGVTSEGVGEIAIAVDYSGSIKPRQLGLCEAEIQSLLAGQRPRRVPNRAANFFQDVEEEFAQIVFPRLL
jgi:hypothetical protein